jgi:hypothetical protein
MASHEKTSAPPQTQKHPKPTSPPPPRPKQEQLGTSHRIGPMRESMISENLEDSFPASDPPSWTPATTGSPHDPPRPD